jgi:Flp pilus assembly protein TadD
MDVTILRSLGLCSALVFSAGVLSSAVQAQLVDESALDALNRQAPAVVPNVSEPAGAVELRAAMRRISFNPSDADALADAGNASLALGDANAALNFLTRANAIRPNNSRIVSGLATATVRTENPFEALRLFDDAVRLGATERSIAADRALAFDLLGNFGRAQQDYQLARTAASSDDIIIRQAVSLSLAGQKEPADAMLVPLLQRNSATAWRARALMLAARGDLRESNKVAQGFMDATSAQKMERFFRLMPNLTSAQQAAAIHLGHFPTSQSVGRDSEQVRRVAATLPQTAIAPAENRLIPSGSPLGPKSAKARDAKSEAKPLSKRDRRAQERAEVQAVAANIPDALKLPKTDTARLGTAAARAAVTDAQSARITSVGNNTLPSPEAARPLVRVALPPATLAAGAPPVRTPPVQTATVQPPPVQTAPRPDAVVAKVEPAATVAVITPPTVQPAVKLAAISPAATTTIPSATIPASILSTTGAQAGAPVTTAATPAFVGPPATLGPAGVSNAAAQPSTTLSAPAEAQVAIPSPVPAATAATGFSLDAIVGAIEIPESEQRPSQIPVDLKKLKPATPKALAAAEASKAAKVDPKLAAKAKLEAANPARFWVQIATGEASALGFDYRKWTKKNPELFKAQNPWTSPWGKTARLLVGPFADMKAAKKWEGEFKKAGGGGFMWKSENGVPVNAIKGK